jgi:hypothetical protein
MTASLRFRFVVLEGFTAIPRVPDRWVARIVALRARVIHHGRNDEWHELAHQRHVVPQVITVDPAAATK